MTLLTVTKDVCAKVGVLVPSSVFSNLAGNRTMQEMLALANEMAQRIAYDTRDWTALRAQITVTGNGASEYFPLPPNFKRMLLTTNVWRSTSTQAPMRFIPDHDEWIQRSLAGSTNGSGEWTILKNSIYIRPVMSVGTVARFMCLDRNCVQLASGGYGDSFQNDNDSFVLDERLLKLGMIWQWQAYKGAPYAEDMGSYSDALANAMGHDSPAPIIVGHLPISANATVAYQGQVP